MGENQFKAARSRLAVHYQPTTHKVTASAAFLLLGALSLVVVTTRAQAQAPGLLWTTNIGARVFAVDSQTNVYANAGGTVTKLTGAGVPFQTNSICPRPGLAQRDPDGNYYFAGVLPSHIGPSLTYLEFEPQDFGGIVLSNLPVYVAKYSAAGTLLWATNFGPAGPLRGITVYDLVLGSDGSVFVGYLHFTSTLDHSPVAAKLTGTGAYIWSTLLPKYGSWSATTGNVRLTPTTTELYALTYIGNSGRKATLSRIDAGGVASVITNWPTPYEVNNAPRTIVNSFGDFYNVEELPNSGTQFTKRQPSGSVIWRFYTGNFAQRVVGPDQFDGVHVATDTGELSRYDYDGNLAWAMNLPSNCEDLILDSQGNRFMSLSGGVVARLGGEPLLIPAITNGPHGQTVLAGSNAVFTVGAFGTTPLRYYWRFVGTNIPNATNSTLTLTNVATSQAGNYQVVVSNHVGSVTSSPVLLRVKNVAIFVGDQLLTNGTYIFSNPPTITIRSAFVSGSAFFTLDGSTPSFGSTPYSAPFTLSSNATIRALGYSADFSQSEEADEVTVVVLPHHTLSVSTSGGGSVGLNPPNCITPPPGLVASWRGEGNTIDSIGTNHGTAEGLIGYAQGEVQQAIAFDGTNGIIVPASAGLNVGSGNGFTLELWFNLKGETQAPSFSWWAPGGTLALYHCSLYLFPQVGIMQFDFQNADTSGHYVATGAGFFTSNAMHHAAVTYDKASGVGTLYLDGSVVAQANLGTTTIPFTSGDIYLGRSGNGAYRINGFLDEISLYSRALSAAEVQSIYQAGTAGKCVMTPAAGSYLTTDTATPTAFPLPGYSFLYWLGDAAGTNRTINVSMERDKSIYAVFGTTLATTVAGNGQVQLSPPGGAYAYGTVVRLTGIPDPGNYFGFWGNAASGNTNPLYFTISAPTQTVSSIFAATPAGQAALTTLINGRGRVNVNPRANLYAINQTVTLTPLPDAGETFLNWSGDGSGTQNPLTISMTQSKVITANLTSRPFLRVDRPGVEGFTSAGFRFTLVSDPQSAYQILASTNLSVWSGLGTLTNLFGEAQFTDTNAFELPARFYKAAP